jgi:uncharacterized membrane protein
VNHNRILWILQWVVGLFFVAVGVMHFVVPEGLPPQLEWMYDLDASLHYVSGTAEILGGLGLILPAVTRRATFLVPLAALGLLIVMVSAAVWHGTRGETINIGMNVVNALVLAYIAYGRWKLAPIR